MPIFFLFCHFLAARRQEKQEIKEPDRDLWQSGTILDNWTIWRPDISQLSGFCIFNKGSNEKTLMCLHAVTSLSLQLHFALLVSPRPSPLNAFHTVDFWHFPWRDAKLKNSLWLDRSQKANFKFGARRSLKMKPKLRLANFGKGM